MFLPQWDPALRVLHAPGNEGALGPGPHSDLPGDGGARMQLLWNAL